MDCFDAGMISIILIVILYSKFRYAISNVNKVVTKQIGNFLFAANNPVIFFQDNVIGLLTFSKKERKVDQNSRGFRCLLSSSFYCFSFKRGTGPSYRVPDYHVSLLA